MAAQAAMSVFGFRYARREGLTDTHRFLRSAGGVRIVTLLERMRAYPGIKVPFRCD